MASVPSHEARATPVPLRVAITGAGGFLGAATARRLVADGAEVLAIVRPGGDRRRLATIPRALSYLEVDLDGLTGRAVRDLEDALRSFAADALLHAGWMGARGEARRDPAQTRNVAQTVEVVRAAAAAGVRRFVGVGSQAEYGPYDRPIHEDDCPRPVTLYGAAKLAAGHLVLSLADRLGMSVAWVRTFSVYGPGESGGALVPDLIRALASGRPLPLTTCEQRWDYLYEDDAADAFARALARPHARGFLNLASGEARPLRETVTLLRELVAPGAPLLFGALPGAAQRLEADVSRARAALGWEPAVSLEEGLRRTVSGVLQATHAAGARS